MLRLAISVEGPTEREFCEKILYPLLLEKDINLKPISINGNCSLDRITDNIKMLRRSFDYISTMYDFYGFKGDYQSADDLEDKLREKINSSKFIPYIQKYEFETLLFSKPSYYKKFLKDDKAEQDIRKIIDDFNGNIENINNSKATSPSHRLIDIFEKYGEKYDKVFYGYGIIEDIGLKTVRKKCPRFDKWINILLGLKK